MVDTAIDLRYPMTPPRSTHPIALVLLAILIWLAFAGRARAESAPLTVRVAVPQVLTDYTTYVPALVHWEGRRNRPYRDGEGWSVGVGHSLTMNRESAIWSRPYTELEVERMLVADLSWALDAARKGVDDFDSLPIEVRRITVGIAFTVGRTGFERFVDLRRSLSRRAFDAAATSLLFSRWRTQVSRERYLAYRAVLRAAR